MTIVQWILAGLLVCGALCSSVRAEEPKLRIALAGDSTVTDGAGWGLGFARCWKESAEVLNFSQGGRSSKSFRDEGHWQKMLEAKPSVVLIQFGHNDQPGKGPERETDPQTTYRANMLRYVQDVRAIGATPVLVTSLARRHFVDETEIKPTLAEYVRAAIDLAREENVLLIDLDERSTEVCRSLGRAASERYI